MKRATIVFALVLASAVLPRLALAQQPKPAAKQAPAAAVEQQILQLEQNWSAAAQKKDGAYLQKLYADEYLFTDTDGSVSDKAEDIAHLSANVVFTSFNLEDMKVHVYGTTAVVTGRNTIQATADGQDISGSYRFTDVFVKRDGRWQVVATQSSKVTKK